MSSSPSYVEKSVDLRIIDLADVTLVYLSGGSKYPLALVGVHSLCRHDCFLPRPGVLVLLRGPSSTTLVSSPPVPDGTARVSRYRGHRLRRGGNS